MVVTSVDSVQAFKVISSKEIATMVGIERQKQMLGCSDSSSCMAEFANALGADYVMVASVGRVGDNYFVSTKLIDGSRNTVAARASVQAKSANSLLEAIWRATQQTLDAYGASLPDAEAAKWAARPKPVAPATLIAAEEHPSYFGVFAGASFGYQPLSVPGMRSSVGAQVDVTWRRDRLDLSLGVAVGYFPGVRLTAEWALLADTFRLDVGLQGAAFPGVRSLYGGGATVSASVALSKIFSLQARVAGEAYPTQGTVIVALLGTGGVAARF
jgi:hypothetical protein